MAEAGDGPANSLIYDYLSSTPLLSSIAKLFKKTTNAEALPAKSPKLKHIISEYNLSPQKRKSTDGVTSAQKKFKKGDTSSDDSSSDEEVVPKLNGVAKKSTPGKKTGR